MHLSSGETVLNRIIASAEVRWRPVSALKHNLITKSDADHMTQKNKRFFMINPLLLSGKKFILAKFQIIDSTRN